MSGYSYNAAASSSTSHIRHAASSAPGAAGGPSNLWSEILSSAERGRGRNALRRKNIVLLSERNHGRSHLLSRLIAGKEKKKGKKDAPRGETLAMGYEVLEAREDGDEDGAPPISVFYPPSSSRQMLKLVPRSLPPNSLSDTAVMIVLDWTKPGTMVKELITWLNWVEHWATESAERGQLEELKEKLQSHIQHYNEPAASTPGSIPPLSTYSGGPLLPLGQGTLTLNATGVPIVVVCTRADLMDTVGDEVGMKGQWEERTDWIQQVIRTLCLAYGAGLFYTASTQPHTYTLLKEYLIHRLYTTPPPLNPGANDSLPPVRFPFAHRANVLDRDAVMVPAGWDSWGKINVLRERFDPARVLKAWELSIKRGAQGADDAEIEGDEEGIEDLWNEMIPDTSKPKISTGQAAPTTTEPEQSFLARQLDILLKDPQRDPRASFRTAAAAVSASAAAAGASNGESGVVGPMGSGGLSLPGVEKAMAEMEGGSAEDMKEKFARLGRRDTTRTGPLSPTGADGRPGDTVQNEALHNFFQGLLATRGKSGTPAKSTSPTAPPKSETETKAS